MRRCEVLHKVQELSVAQDTILISELRVHNRMWLKSALSLVRYHYYGQIYNYPSAYR